MAEKESVSGNKFEEIKEQMISSDSNTIGIAVALLVGLVTLILIFVWTRRRSLGRDVLICGPCDSGKTTLLSQLVVGKPVETYTSMAHNKFSMQIESKPSINLVDIPGHERIRSSIVDEFAGSARGILYVVDSNTIAKQVRDVAEFLHSILSIKTVHKNSPPLAVFCNKQDGGLAKTAQVIKTLLEKEIEKVRVTSSHQLEGLEGETSNKVFLGKEGKSFEFSDISNSVTFVEGIANDIDSLSKVREWLIKIA